MRENKNFEEMLPKALEFLATVKMNTIKSWDAPKETKELVWKKLAIPFKSYLHINDLTWEEVNINILSELDDMARRIMGEKDLMESIAKAKGEGKQVTLNIDIKDFLCDEMETLLFAFVNTITKNGGKEYVVSVLDKEYNKVA